MKKAPFTVSILILSVFLLAACTTQGQQPGEFQLGEEFSLSTGQSAIIKDEGLQIKFLEVVTDSRCPNGATCIWRGEVNCLVEITYRESSQKVILTQPGLMDEPSGKSFEAYQISFNVEPYPEVGKSLFRDDYRLLLKLSRA